MMKLFLNLFNMSITASWLVLAIILIRLLLKKAPKFFRCVLWALVAVRLICPFSVPSFFSMIPSRETIPQEVIEREQLVIDSGFHTVNSVVNPGLSQMEGTAGAENLLSKGIEIGTAVWAAGAVLMLGYAVVSYIILRRKTKISVKDEAGIWLCDQISDPFILGIFRPQIFMPSSVGSEDKAYVVAHEKAHIKRGDHIWKPIGFLLLSIYWFNPVLWVAYILLCRDIEMACDEKVIKALGENRKKEYSTALVNCSTTGMSVTACPVAFGEVGVKSRVKAVLNYRKPALWVLIAAVIAGSAAVLFFMTDPFQYVSDVVKPGSIWKATNCEAEFYVDEDYGIEGKIVVENGIVPICIMYRERYAEIYDCPAALVQQKDMEPVITGGLRIRGDKLHFILYEDGLGLGVKRLIFEKTERGELVGDSIDQPAEIIDWRNATVLVCEESPDFKNPTILLSPYGNRFQFNWSMLSSYIAMGTYEVTEDELILTTDDELQNVYVFEKTFAGYRFVEEKSSRIPRYKYSQGGEAESPVPDGALFKGIIPIEDREILQEGYSIEMHSIIADIDGDGRDEYCSLLPGPTSGLFSFCFSATEVGAEEREYFNTFTTSYLELSFVMDENGTVQLRGESPLDHGVRFFAVSVQDGNIVLEDEEGKMAYWGEQGVNAPWAVTE